MPPEHAISFGGGAESTSLNPIVLVALLLGVILVLCLPRRRMMVPILLALLVPLGSVIVLGPAHLFALRSLIILGLGRLMLARTGPLEPTFWGGRNAIDKAFITWSILMFVANALLFQDGAAVFNQVAVQFLDYLGLYVLLRFSIKDEEDVYRSIKCIVVVILVCSVGMIIEQKTMNNPFGAIGGAMHPDVRNGAIRSQGPFLHSLPAGAFAASSLPLIFLLWRAGKKKRLLATMGIAGAAVMTYTSHGSGPLLAFMAGILGTLLWPIREHMRKVRWGIVATIAALAMVMKAPVWFIIARVDLTGSSTSYDRAMLVDNFIRHFWEWWLVGVKSTGNWGWDMWDVQNQFVAVGVSGGLASFIVFLTMIVRTYKRLGTARKAAGADIDRKWRSWLVGSALFGTIAGFFGINYYDQSKAIWIAIIAIASAVAGPALRSRRQASRVQGVGAPIGDRAVVARAPGRRLAPGVPVSPAQTW